MRTARLVLHLWTALGVAAMLLPATRDAAAFCGFYVAKADAALFNRASKVVITRHDGKTVITMVNDYQGALQEFAMVVPVPSVLERGQIHVTENALIDQLDAYTAPRLVEYFDADPCRAQPEPTPIPASAVTEGQTATALGVEIEAEYAVGEYNIAILSAEQSAGLTTWLRQNGYHLPEGAEDVLAGYLANDMRFLVARVNLEEQSKLGYSYLRPLQVAFESDQFMLPIRLGMLNAVGAQELLLFVLTRGGRVETVNYRTVEIPSDLEVPLFVKNAFGEFYRALFDDLVAKEGMRAVFLEYAWGMNRCDPCAADPLSYDELRELGVFWREEPEAVAPTSRGAPSQASDVFVTRLHLRYDAARFPEDLQLVETDNRSNFQGRYVLRHPWTARAYCTAAGDYFQSLPARYEQEAQNLARLTAWPIAEIRTKMEAGGQSFTPIEVAPDERTWWQKIWPDNE